MDSASEAESAENHFTVVDKACMPEQIQYIELSDVIFIKIKHLCVSNLVCKWTKDNVS